MFRKALTAALIGVSATTLLSGCAGSSSPEAVVQAFLQRYADGDIEGACSLVAEDGHPLDEVGLQQCRGLLDMAAMSDDGKLVGRSVEVTGSQIDGDSATVDDDAVLVDGEVLIDPNSDPMELELIDGTWYVVDLG